MSSMFEAVIFHAEGPSALELFQTILSPLHLRLVDLWDGLFGIYRIADEDNRYDWDVLVEKVAGQASARFGSAVVLLYNDQCGTRMGVLYEDGRRIREFGELDERWVPYGEDGSLEVDGPHLSPSQLLPDIEYDCIFSAITASLMAIGAWPTWDTHLLVLAFCYEEMSWMAEFGEPKPKQRRERGKPTGS